MAGSECRKKAAARNPVFDSRDRFWDDPSYDCWLRSCVEQATAGIGRQEDIIIKGGSEIGGWESKPEGRVIKGQGLT